LVRGIEFLLRSNGVEVVRGEARFADPKTVAVAGPEGESLSVCAGDIVIATGSRPAVLPGFEPDGRAVVDSNGMLKIIEIPKRLVVIGAGAIGLEFATIFARLGSEVTVLELMEQVLPGMDHEVASSLQKTMKSEGIAFHLGARVAGLDAGACPKVSYSTAEGTAAVEADLVLVATGRNPLTEGLELDQAGVSTDERGFIPVDDKYRTRVRHIHAIGDVKPGPQLAHKAMAEGIAVAEVIAGSRQWRFKAIPSCVYTDPEVASVGVGEAEAQQQGLKVKTSRVPLSAVGRSLTLGRSEGLCKMVVDSETDRVLGMQMVAPEADALIGEAAVAVELGLTAAQLGRVVHPHPTMSELLFEAAEAIHGRAIHIVNR
jgi:dihydrolipoamide dehydrogenase